MNGLQDKIGLVVGGANGVGRATAIRLAQEGAKVVIADLNAEGAAAVADTIRESGGDAASVAADLRSEQSINAAVQFTVDTFGRVDLLHNVGFNPVLVTTKDLDILDTAMDDYEEMLATTLRGYVLSCRAVIPHMLANGGGAIVNTSSLAGLRALPTGLRFSYSIAKSGLGPLSQHIAVRFGKQNIRCNTAALGMVISESFMATMSPDRVQVTDSATLTPKPAGPDDIAAAVVFLLSDDARYITGQTINVDGGVSARL